MSLSSSDDDCTLWRYVSFHEFYALFESKCLPLRSFIDLVSTDSEEGKIPPTLVDKVLNEDFIKQHKEITYVTCWHKSYFEYHLMWRDYAPRGFGIKTTKFSLSDVLNLANNAETEEYPSSFVPYDVDYLEDSEFTTFRSGESPITQILSRKRKAFFAENEVGFMYLDVQDSISWKTYADCKRWLLVPIKNFEWVKSVHYDPSLAEWLVDSVMRMLEPYAIQLTTSTG